MAPDECVPHHLFCTADTRLCRLTYEFDWVSLDHGASEVIRVARSLHAKIITGDVERGVPEVHTVRTVWIHIVTFRGAVAVQEMNFPFLVRVPITGRLAFKEKIIAFPNCHVLHWDHGVKCPCGDGNRHNRCQAHCNKMKERNTCRPLLKLHTNTHTRHARTITRA